MLHKKIGDIEIPVNYFQLSTEQKAELCENIYKLIHKAISANIHPQIDNNLIMHKLLESSIMSNEETENYEICQVLSDIKQIINE
jgi:hypothetical protein